MKKFHIPILFFSLALICTQMSCKKDSDTQQGGRDQFFGTYICDETYTPFNGNHSYEMTIVASVTSEDDIVLQNIHDEIDVVAKVNGNSFTITEDDNPPGYITTGTGSLNGKILTMEYQIPELVISGGGPGTVYDCKATCTKQ